MNLRQRTRRYDQAAICEAREGSDFQLQAAVEFMSAMLKWHIG
jgi:hypothetical protein